MSPLNLAKATNDFSRTADASASSYIVSPRASETKETHHSTAPKRNDQMTFVLDLLIVTVILKLFFGKLLLNLVKKNKRKMLYSCNCNAKRYIHISF